MRYLLFGSGHCYYASGGAHDFIDANDDLSKLVAYAIEKVDSEESEDDEFLSWWHIFDTATGKIIAGSAIQPFGAD